MFDPITATPTQLAKHCWDLTEQYHNLCDTGAELIAMCGRRDPQVMNITVDIEYLEEEIEIAERLFNISYRDELINRGTMPIL